MRIKPRRPRAGLRKGFSMRAIAVSTLEAFISTSYFAHIKIDWHEIYYITRETDLDWGFTHLEDSVTEEVHETHPR